MDKKDRSSKPRVFKARHRGRFAQIRIYLGKLLRMFVYQNDWKVLPMSALIAALVAMVIRQRFGLSMEGTLAGAFALGCAGIWSGCFNSIQVVCRERNIIKREHRSGMHISSYIMAHMMYQAFLCLIQTVLILVICNWFKVPFPKEGLITAWFIVDLGITLFLLTFSADMLSLLISSVVHSTTAAMTVMPFILIIQLVFSGAMMKLPEWTRSISNFTVSSYGLRSICALSDYNSLPLSIGWETLKRTTDKEVTLNVSLGQVLDFLDDDGTEEKSGTIGSVWNAVNKDLSWSDARDTKIGTGHTVKEVLEFLKGSETVSKALQEDKGTLSSSEIIDMLLTYAEKNGIDDQILGTDISYGGAIDFFVNAPEVQKRRDETLTINTTVGRLIDMVGEEKVKELVMNRTAESSGKEIYEKSEDNVIGNWVMLVVFSLLYASLATIFLEFIDKDRR